MHYKVTKAMRTAVAKHYGLHSVTEQQVRDEIANLARRGMVNWYDSQFRLSSALQQAGLEREIICT